MNLLNKIALYKTGFSGFCLASCYEMEVQWDSNVKKTIRSDPMICLRVRVDDVIIDEDLKKCQNFTGK